MKLLGKDNKDIEWAKKVGPISETVKLSLKSQFESISFQRELTSMNDICIYGYK